MLSGLQEEFHDPMKLIRNPLYYSEDAARWKKTSLFFWILLVLAVWTVIYVFMCDVLWSKNRGAWLRGTIFSPNFSLNWRFIQNPYMLSRFQGPGVDESRSKLWWNNFINVDKNGEKEVVYPKLLPFGDTVAGRKLHSSLEICRSDGPRLQQILIIIAGEVFTHLLIVLMMS